MVQVRRARKDQRMKQRWEIVDGHNPTWRGQRFSSLDRARRELALAVGVAGRWSIVDRATGAVVEHN